MSKKQIFDTVKLFIKKVKQSGIPVKMVYIFGSSVKGKFDRGSDIDTCIISPNFGKDRQKERLILMNLRDNNMLLIEPHPFSPKEFKNKYDPLLMEIKRTGIKLT